MTNPNEEPKLSAHLTESAAKKLKDDPRARAALAKKNPAFGDLDSAHSAGPKQKPVLPSSKQGKREKKVRW
ncbi:hypothetical protein [Arthrobacter sp. H5]|uniref:hypothetical protein n=1 Tax=Arthrobacter sp. H5 TaxID=1267973 RepID=UPI000483A5EF|nr:hypothetical protein [Arthrobacter sp. H5]